MSLATALLQRFAADRRGVVAVVYALTLLPLMMGIGAAVDYSRASSSRVDLQSAVDAAALAVGRVAIELGRTDNTVQAREAFDAGFQRNDGTAITRFQVTQDLKIVVDVDARVPLAFGKLLRIDSIDVKARAEVPLDDMTVEVALVLDNTGSMAASNKMVYLKEASKSLITKLQNASVVNTNAFVAIVPFTTQVRLPISVGPHPYGGTYDPVNTIPGVRINHPKDAAEPKLNVTFPWYGCLIDRDQPNDSDGYDGQGVPLVTSLPETLLPASNCLTALSPVRPLGRDFTALRTHIDSMGTAGATNTGIGLAAGLAVLTPSLMANNPILNTGARQPSRFVKKHLIFLTDGENTMNRWSTDPAQIDGRTQQICTEIKQSNLNIVLHTILLMQGNATLLQNCASTPERYHFVTDPTQLNAVFDAIAAELLYLRIGS
jgi:Flp pilus assembly protein TadG